MRREAVVVVWLAAAFTSCDAVTQPSPIKRSASLPRKKLGNSDMMVTEVCAGTMTWGSFVDEEADAHAQLDKLVELGVNFIDTAELYPVAFNYGETTERWIGNWLKTRVATKALVREHLYIATKCNPAGIGSPDPTPHNFTAERLEASARASLARLNIEFVNPPRPSLPIALYMCVYICAHACARACDIFDHMQVHRPVLPSLPLALRVRWLRLGELGCT